MIGDKSLGLPLYGRRGEIPASLWVIAVRGRYMCQLHQHYVGALQRNLFNFAFLGGPQVIVATVERVGTVLDVGNPPPHNTYLMLTKQAKHTSCFVTRSSTHTTNHNSLSISRWDTRPAYSCVANLQHARQSWFPVFFENKTHAGKCFGS